MKAHTNVAPLATAENVIPLAIEKRSRPSPKVPQRFKIQAFDNRGGSVSWRVTGIKRTGERVRENFKDEQSARCRQIELEAEYHAGHSDTAMRATKLSHEQIQLAEVAYIKLGEDWQRILDAVDHWNKTGKPGAITESPRVDEAYTQFKTWLDGKDCTLRKPSRDSLDARVKIFVNSIGNFRVNMITIEIVENFLDGLSKVSALTKDNYRRAISRFFSWCIERPRRWASVNPCRGIKLKKGEAAPPSVLTVDECKAVLNAAETHGLAPYVALCLFGGIRPDAKSGEITKLDWPAINLKDREILIEGNEAKTKRTRTVSICDTLAEWLQAYKGKPIIPPNLRRRLDAVKEAAGFTGRVTEDDAGMKEWPRDVMRHTAISHFFRKTHSYGKSAEQFGNSEAIIKRHYQGRVTSDETKKFYALRPTKGGRK